MWMGVALVVPRLALASRVCFAVGLHCDRITVDRTVDLASSSSHTATLPRAAEEVSAMILMQFKLAVIL